MMSPVIAVRNATNYPVIQHNEAEGEIEQLSDKHFPTANSEVTTSHHASHGSPTLLSQFPPTPD
jgi:hypothetical protein